MGQIEGRNQKKTRRRNVQRIVLGTIAAAGSMSIALLAPNVFKTFDKLSLVPRERQKESIAVARKRLVEKGLLEYRDGLLHITPKGEGVLRAWGFANVSTRKIRRWDGKWRILVFDVPERRRVIRDKLRRALAAIGFVEMQKSVWIYPYDCEDLITLLKADFKMGKGILYIIADEVEHDKPYRTIFNLPPPRR